MEWFDFACPLRLEGRRGVLCRLSSAQTMKVVEGCLNEVNHLALCLCISDLRTCSDLRAKPRTRPLLRPSLLRASWGNWDSPKWAKTAHSENYYFQISYLDSSSKLSAQALSSQCAKLIHQALSAQCAKLIVQALSFQSVKLIAQALSAQCAKLIHQAL